MRQSKPDFIRQSKPDLRQSKPDLRKSRLDIRQSKPDFIRQSRPDIRHSKPDFGLDFQVEVVKFVKIVPSSRGQSASPGDGELSDCV